MRFAIVVEYDGTEFHGSQLQRNARTVQGDLEGALSDVFNKNIRVHFASRTDSGVHARGQVGCFDIQTDLLPDQVRKALNHQMSKDVRIRCAQFVPDGSHGFDPRGDAQSRTYVYTFNDALSEPALERHFVTHVRKHLDAVAMNEASQFLKGKHDFAAFAGLGMLEGTPTCRIVEHASVMREGTNVEFTITANSFFRQQIRRIAGVLYDVGVGKYSAESVYDLLIASKRGIASYVMPARGLSLEKISFVGSGKCGLPTRSSDTSVN
jgi:tRNA pseudouridine38-40 synthase